MELGDIVKLVGRWEEGYEKGRSDQKTVDADVLEEAIADVYERSWSEGYDNGYIAGLKDKRGDK